MNDSPHQDHSKRVFYYYLAAILIILVINTIITPMFFKPRVPGSYLYQLPEDG